MINCTYEKVLNVQMLKDSFLSELLLAVMIAKVKQ